MAPRDQEKLTCQLVSDNDSDTSGSTHENEKEGAQEIREDAAASAGTDGGREASARSQGNLDLEARGVGLPGTFLYP